MNGFIGLAPIYLNGLLALFFLFVFPGLVLIRACSIQNFPQRWLAIFLISLTANHWLVTLVAVFNLSPLQTYRFVAVALVIVLISTIAMKRTEPGAGTSTVRLSDIKWLLASAAVLCIAYFHVWRHGVPNVFQGSDPSISWNVWALIWSEGRFPTGSYGYPQLIPTIWAVTYIFIGSNEQYFAYYTHIILIIVPIVLTATILSRTTRWLPMVSVIVFAWFVTEVREGWIRSTLAEAFPDWEAAIFAFCGVVLFAANAPGIRFGRDKIITALLSLCMATMAAATKPIFGLFAIALLAAICIDAGKNLGARDRNRFLAAAIGLFLAFVVAYALVYTHLAVRSLPHYPVSDLSARLARAFSLFDKNFTLPFRIVAVAGLLMSPFLPRVRWLALPLWISISVWANAASYDLRNVLGPIVICTFIPVYAAGQALIRKKDTAEGRRWIVPDVAIAAGLAVAAIGLTLTLAVSDRTLKQRFANEQLRWGMGFELNSKVDELLHHGCAVFSADAYITTISAFQPFRARLRFFHPSEPLTDLLRTQFDGSGGCVVICYSPDRTHPSVLSYIIEAISTGRYRKVAETNGMTLVVSGS